MAELKPLRANQLNWAMRFTQLLVTLIILAITGNNASIWGSVGCSTPSRLAWNIACAALTLPVLIYLILSSGPKPNLQWHLLPWSAYGQLGIDAVYFFLWLMAACFSNYTCTDLCDACSALDVGYGWYVYVGNLECICYSDNDVLKAKRATSSGDAKAVADGIKLAAKIGFDAFMVILFAVTLGTTAWHLWQARQAGMTSSTAQEFNSYGAAPQQQYQNVKSPANMNTYAASPEAEELNHTGY